MGQARRPIIAAMTKMPAVAVAALLVSAASAQTTARLDWLAGCWQAQPGEAGSVEIWMAPAGGAMLGISRTLRGGQVRQWEFMLIRDTPQGLEFVASPSGQNTASFRVETFAARSVVFHNPDHDFPQRVAYASPDADTLNAHIEGVRNGQSRTVRFPMKRVACP